MVIPMATKDVTTEMERFRRRSRSVWDICISDLEQLFDTTDQFKSFRRWLFCEMVFGDGGEAKIREQDVTVRSTLGLREGEVHVLAGNGILRLRMRKDSSESCSTVSTIETLLSTNTDVIYLCDLFDWNVLGAMDHAYYLVKVAKSELHPELTGFYGLVEPANCILILHAAD